MHLFFGPTRDGDLGSEVKRLATQAGLEVLMLSADLGWDSNWNLETPKTFALLYELCRDGLVDIIGGGLHALPALASDILGFLVVPGLYDTAGVHGAGQTYDHTRQGE